MKQKLNFELIFVVLLVVGCKSAHSSSEIQNNKSAFEILGIKGDVEKVEIMSQTAIEIHI